MLPIQGGLQGLCRGKKELLKDGVAIKGKGKTMREAGFEETPLPQRKYGVSSGYVSLEFEEEALAGDINMW